jgi:mono/diheme cytochrome c family protein
MLFSASVPFSALKSTSLVCALVLATAGCRQDMHDAPRYEPYEKSDFFPDRRSARPLVAGTVARGHLHDDSPVNTGRVGAAFVATLPVPVTMELVRRGQQRYDIFCSPCHGLTGRGDGMVVRRGFRPPASFHDARLRAQPDGYVFDVMTNGFGAMPDYATQLPIADRWAVVAYVRALQLSQNATLADVPADRRGELTGAAAPQGTPGATAEEPHR